MYQVYHNPRCKISRSVVDELQKHNAEIQIIDYQKNIPGIEELKKLLAKLHLKPFDIIRKNEKIFKEKFQKKKFTDDEWLIIIREYPILMERPIVVKNNKAIICRPPERIEEFL
ncbi:MAG TPA: ArsC/Spx/MgsR family protein [Bacteroidales bacterium]|nr:ArsC/Spx/MgsR family protein [Bacteroidales bacterium]HPS16473.1 ArsC/Spx/MgsR family protein [Bacteroidales bacterium]